MPFSSFNIFYNSILSPLKTYYMYSLYIYIYSKYIILYVFFKYMFLITVLDLEYIFKLISVYLKIIVYPLIHSINTIQQYILNSYLLCVVLGLSCIFTFTNATNLQQVANDFALDSHLSSRVIQIKHLYLIYFISSVLHFFMFIQDSVLVL